MTNPKPLEACNCGTIPISESYHKKAWEVYCPNIDCIVVFVVRPTKELAEQAWNKHHTRPTQDVEEVLREFDDLWIHELSDLTEPTRLDRLLDFIRTHCQPKESK